MVENMGKSKGRADSAEEAPFEEVMERLQAVVEQLGEICLSRSLWRCLKRESACRGPERNDWMKLSVE
jgi:hypothetical protein